MRKKEIKKGGGDLNPNSADIQVKSGMAKKELERERLARELWDVSSDSGFRENLEYISSLAFQIRDRAIASGNLEKGEVYSAIVDGFIQMENLIGETLSK